MYSSIKFINLFIVIVFLLSYELPCMILGPRWLNELGSWIT